MHILILGQHYAPEEVSGAVLARELAEGLLARGHQVTFVTAAPSYPQGKVFEGYRNVLLAREKLNGVHVIRVWSSISPSRSFWSRILSYGTFSLMALLGGLAAGRVDVMMSASPPLPLGLSAWLVSRIRRIPWLLRVEDLYPQTAVNAGVLRNRLAIRFFEWLEKFIYRKAAHISLISEGFRQNLLAKGISPSKLSVLPVWADPHSIHPLPKENGFRRAHGLEGKFVLLYAGNLGHTSALEDVVEAARLLKDERDTVFVIIGEGVKKEALQSRALRCGLENVCFLPYQPREVYAEALAAADVSLVTLNPAASHTSLPSKMFNVMASARPILAVADAASEMASLVQMERCGVVVPPSQPVLLAETIRALRSRPAQLEEWGRNGRAALEERYSREACLDAYDAMFRSLVMRRIQRRKGQPVSVNPENIIQRLARNAAQGKRKFTSLYRAHGLRMALQAAWRNVFLVETVCRLEKDLAIPDSPVTPAIPLHIETLNSASDLTTWTGKKEILALRGAYGMEQFHARLKRGDLCFTAYSEGGFAGFVWLEFPPGNEAGYPLQPHEAYTYDGWTFEPFRGKRVLPAVQQSIMGYVRAHHANIRTLVTHVAVWNKPSLSGDQRAGYVLRRLERTVMILGIHRKQILSANIPAELVMHRNMP